MIWWWAGKGRLLHVVGADILAAVHDPNDFNAVG